MASINYATRQISVKIVYYGPGLSGKTTNLQVIHKKTPQEHKSDMVSLATETDRTLFFDFLPLDLGKIKGFATKFQLYTVPGQVYYNATRKLVLRGVDGVVFVADSGADKVQENLESFQNLEDNLAEYGYQRESVPIIIQYNKRDLPNALPIDELNRLINKYNLPWGEGIAYKGVGVFDTLKQIGKIVIDYLNKKYSRSSPGSRGTPAAPPPVSAPVGGRPDYRQPPAQGFQQPSGFQPPAAQGFQPSAGGFQQPPGAQGFQPPQSMQSFQTPPAQGFQPPQSMQGFQTPPARGFQQPMPPNFQPASTAFPEYPPRQQSFAPPPPPPSPPAYDSFEMTPPVQQAPAPQQWSAPQQPYQQPAQSFQKPPATAAFPDYQPPQQSFAPPPPPPQQSYDSFEIAAPTPQAPAPQQQWGAAPQSYKQPTPPASFADYSQPSGSQTNYDDIFMVPPPSTAPPPPPSAPSGFSQNGEQGGDEQSPFSTETALPPPSSHQRQPLAGAQSGGIGAPSGAALPQQQPIPAGQTGGYTPPPQVAQPQSAFQAQPMNFAPPPQAAQPQSAFQAQPMNFAPPQTPQNPAPPPFQAEPYSPPQTDGYDDMASMPNNSAIFEFEAELSASVNKNNVPAEDDYPSDSAIFFSSVNSKNAIPKKGPVINPAKKNTSQQKSFVSKFFNKN